MDPEAEADSDPEAREICLRLLARAPRTRAQLARALARRNVPEHVAERVLARFADVGLIDDATFAAAWVESRHVGRGLGSRALAHELRARGVDDDLVDEAVGGLSPERELATARDLVVRRLPSTRALDPPARMRRLVGMLARRGYSSGVVKQAIRDALSTEGGPGDGSVEWLETLSGSDD